MYVGAFRKIDSKNTQHIEIVAAFLAAGRIAPDLCQSSIMDPKTRWPRSQLCRRVEDRAKKKAANNKNGTVGSKGSTIPTKARPTHSKPKAAQRNCMCQLLSNSRRMPFNRGLPCWVVFKILPCVSIRFISLS